MDKQNCLTCGYLLPVGYFYKGKDGYAKDCQLCNSEKYTEKAHSYYGQRQHAKYKDEGGGDDI